MSHTCAESASIHTLASGHARDNFAANFAALQRIQPRLHAEQPADVDWIFGRDRSLTCRDSTGRWATGCSLPRRAAAQMMQKLEISGSTACFLAPTHAAQIRVALDRLWPEQAIVAIVPDADQLGFLLSCEAFTDAIEANRLWFAIGEQWPAELRKIFIDNPGLCTPSQFIRLPIAEDETVEPLILAAQKTFLDINTDRATQIQTLRQNFSRGDRICIVASSRFRLWDDAGATLAELFDDPTIVRIDLDNPSQASALAMAQAVQGCRAVVTANTSRADLPGVLSDSIPWITWAAADRIPNSRGAAPCDRLITANPRRAIELGWRKDQVTPACWPWLPRETKPGPSGPGNASLSLITNTHPLDPPTDLTEFSSHRLLWELIAADLHDNPFALTDDIEGFLLRRMRKLNIASETLPKHRFIADLILPAYQQSIARLLLREKLPVKLFGAGWERLPEFAPHACCAVESREKLREIASDSAGLVHILPSSLPHPIDALGKPVLRCRSSNRTSFISDAKQILTGRFVAPLSTLSPLSREMIENIAT